VVTMVLSKSHAQNSRNGLMRTFPHATMVPLITLEGSAELADLL